MWYHRAMDNFRDEPTQPIIPVELHELDPSRCPTTRRSRTAFMGHPQQLTCGLELTAPNGVQGYISGRSFDGSGRILFVIVEGTGRHRQNTLVEVWPEAFAGWTTKTGDRL